MPTKQKSPSALRREQEKIQRKANILKIAENIFIEKGYDGTYVEEIAEKSGFTKSTLYKYYPTKDELFLAVAAIAFEQFNFVIEQNVTKYPHLDSFMIFKEVLEEFIRKYPGYVFIMDSAKLRPLLINIINKEINASKLTDNEKEFRKQQVISQTFLFNSTNEICKNLKTNKQIDTDLIANMLSQIATSFMIELVRREQMTNQSSKETKILLETFFRIFEIGVINYR